MKNEMVKMLLKELDVMKIETSVLHTDDKYATFIVEEDDSISSITGDTIGFLKQLMKDEYIDWHIGSGENVLSIHFKLEEGK